MRRRDDSYLVPGAFAPTLSLDELYAKSADDDGSPPFDLADREPLADQCLERSEAVNAVKAFIATLPPRDREILRRVYWDDESQSQVASRLGVSKMAISKAMARILGRGRGVLSAHRNVAFAS